MLDMLDIPASGISVLRPFAFLTSCHGPSGARAVLLQLELETVARLLPIVRTHT